MSRPTTQRTSNTNSNRTTSKTVPVNTNYTIKASDAYLLISSSDGTTKVLTPPDCKYITTKTIFMTTFSGAGSYTMVVTGGSLTFNAANEMATVINDPSTSPSTWRASSLVSATIV